MKLLPVPNIDNKSVYSDVLRKKNNVCINKCKEYKTDPQKCKESVCVTCDKSPRTILQQYEMYVEQQYDEYNKIAPDFTKLISTHKYGKDFHHILKNAFNNSIVFKKTKRKIFDSFKDSYRNGCPFCMFPGPDTLDHYLCETKYPQFIIYAPNLVPCCHTCNGKKSTMLMDDNNERMFFHYYYDDIPDIPILECTIFLKNKKPAYSFYVDTTKNGHNAELFRRQFKALDLDTRYADSCVGKLSVLLTELKEHNKKYGENKLKEILNIKLEASIKEQGVNHYETAMLRGMLRDFDQLIDILNN